MPIVLEIEWYLEYSKMTNSLNDDIEMNEWSFEIIKKENLIEFSLNKKTWKLEKKLDMINQLISFDESQDIEFEINCEFNALEK